jgi:hypothetical protein
VASGASLNESALMGEPTSPVASGYRPQARLLALTGLATGVEIAVVTRSLTAGIAPSGTAAVLAIFHAGYLGSNVLPRYLGSRIVCALAGLALGVLSLSCFTLKPSLISIGPLAISCLIFSAAIQTLRRSLKQSGRVVSPRKNAAKAASMLIGGLLGAGSAPSLILVLPASALLAAAAFWYWPPSARVQQSKDVGSRRRILLWAEFLHHAHYFAYCYTFWYLAPGLVGRLLGAFFLIGWLGYFLSERLLTERTKIFSPRMLALGHAVVTGAVAIMPFVSAPAVLGLWFVTGLGGGTAYMLGNAGSSGPRELFEDAGHVAGALAASIIACTAPDSPGRGATATVWLGASLAAATALTFWWAGRAEHKIRTR